MLTAITRQVSTSITRCELTHLDRTPIHLPTARLQHHQYEQALHALSVNVISLPAEDQLPDAVFVEDTAIVLDECAILARPGAPSRRPEVESIARILSSHRLLHTVQAPACLDGGDVLVIGRNLWIGIGSRTNLTAINQVQGFLNPYGCIVHSVSVHGCLHLKSAVTQADDHTLLINPAWVERSTFPDFDLIEVDPVEPYAANILLIADRAIYQPVFPRTLARLEKAGIHPLLVDASELGKAEGALTCCSLIFNADPSSTTASFG